MSELNKWKREEKSEANWPLYHFSHHPDAFVPAAYTPLDHELQPPFCPLNFGVAGCPFGLTARSRLRRWLRASPPDPVFPIERQLDITSHVFTNLYYPFATAAGCDLVNRTIQVAWSDDILEVLGLEAPEAVKEEWQMALKNLKGEADSKSVDENENRTSWGGFAKGLARLRPELAEHFPKRVMRRLMREYRTIADFNSTFPGPPTDGAFFDGLVDEYHFSALRWIDGHGPAFSVWAEMAVEFSPSPEQLASPLVKAYDRVISELDMLANDLVSFEKEFVGGHMFSAVAFMHAFYGLDWKGACVKAHLFYFTLLDKAEDLLARIYSSEFGKDVQLICFLEQRKLEVGATFLSHFCMTRYYPRPNQSRPYSWMQRMIAPDKQSHFFESEEKIQKFNQRFTAFWANVKDPFEDVEKIASFRGFEKHFEKCDWQKQPFSEDLWLKKDGRVGLSGPFAGYDPRQPDKNTLEEMTERFAKVYVWSGEERDWSWQRRCLHRYCERKFGSADWLSRWQKGWMPDYIKPFYMYQ